MRIAIVTESFLPTVNGVTTSVLRVLDHLRACGHDALVIAPDAGTPTHYNGFPVATLPSIAYRQFPVGLPNLRLQRMLAEFAPDVVHVASPLFLGAQAIAASNRLRIPTVAVFQTDVAGFARSHGLGLTSSIAWRYVAWVHGGADLTLVPSASSENDLRRVGVSRLARWGRGVDLQRYHPNRRRAPATISLREQLSPHGETVVGYVGRIAPEKQVERLVALRGVPRLSVAIVGDGPSRTHVEKRLRGMNVTWLGRRDGEALATAYAALDIFVHTGAQETFGQTIQEAHASGLPVIAPNAGGPRDLVESGVTGLLYSPDNDGTLRDAVVRLSENVPERLRMGESGRRSVLSRGWDVIVDELIQRYEQVRHSAKSGPIHSR